MAKIEDVILFQIDLTSKVSKKYSQREFDELGLGITIEQWVVLKIVSEKDGLSQKELAEFSYRDPASITRTLDLLEKKDLLLRVNVPNNRRSYSIQLTKKGKKFVLDNIGLIKKHRSLSIKGLTSSELETLSSLLLKIRGNMK